MGRLCKHEKPGEREHTAQPKTKRHPTYAHDKMTKYFMGRQNQRHKHFGATFIYVRCVVRHSLSSLFCHYYLISNNFCRARTVCLNAFFSTFCQKNLRLFCLSCFLHNFPNKLFIEFLTWFERKTHCAQNKSSLFSIDIFLFFSIR